MLKGEAHKNYTSYIKNRGCKFMGMVNRVRDHFETVERRQLLSNEWNAMNLNISSRRTHL